MTPSEKPKFDAFDFGVVSFGPLVFGKLVILYFGSMYSSHPGEGYGIGLSAAIAFTLVMLGRFLWKYRNFESE